MSTSKVINAFPGYKYYDYGEYPDDSNHHNIYKNIDVGFGGYVYVQEGMYVDVALIDVQSLHPNSIVNMNCFGDYTKRFKDILDARVLIKHHDYEKASKILDGALAPYLSDEKMADDLSKALKIAINSVYGLTSAKFDNPFKDPRNVNNIVALRGALFMIDLKEAVEKEGYTVIHIKTDSIKIANSDDYIVKFCIDFAAKYGYVFEYEALYSKMCIVNGSTYIAKYADSDVNGKHKGEWTATAAQFQQPYVFKTLFSHEQIEFKDMCETKEVKGSLYLDFNEDYHEDDHNYHFVGKVGEFCPILKGCGGGELLRYDNEKYSAAVGTKGYRWLESEMVKELHKEDCIDKSYYIKLVDEAVKAIEKYGDFEWFVSDDERPLIPQDE